MKSDCRKLKESSVYIKNWIQKQPSVKEESLTDWLLFDVSEKIEGIAYRDFTRHEEARETGADWEWWFVFNKYSIKMRIQAKKIKENDDNYPGIAHTNQYGLQIEKLLKDAKGSNSIPLYAFYTRLKENVMCKRAINDEGVYLAEANKIFKDFIENGKQHISPPDIMKLTIPLSCFLCCDLIYEGNNEKGFQRFFSHYFYSIVTQNGEDSKNSFVMNEDMPGLYSEPPNYVSSFIKLSRNNLLNEWESQYYRQLEGINALLVYDARESKKRE